MGSKYEPFFIHTQSGEMVGHKFYSGIGLCSFVWICNLK